MKNDPWNGKNPEDDPIFQSKIQAYRLAEYGPDALKAPHEPGAIDRSIRIVPIQLTFDIELTQEWWRLSEREPVSSWVTVPPSGPSGPTAGQLAIDSDVPYDPFAVGFAKKMLEFKRRYRRTAQE